MLEAERGRLLDAGSVDAFAAELLAAALDRLGVARGRGLGAHRDAAFQLLPGGLLGGASLAGVLPGCRRRRRAGGGAGRALRTSRARGCEPAGECARGGVPGSARRHCSKARPVAALPPRATVTYASYPCRAGLPAARRPRRSPVPGTEPGTGGGTTTQPSSSGSTPPAGGGGPVSSLPRETPSVETPSLPPGKVPPVTVPPVKVPPVSAPSVTTPQVSVGPVTVPSVTVPSVTVKAPDVPASACPAAAARRAADAQAAAAPAGCSG